jgi:hypothetical protein
VQEYARRRVASVDRETPSDIAHFRIARMPVLSLAVERRGGVDIARLAS